MKAIVLSLMLSAFLATSVTTVMAQEKPKKECKQDSTKCQKNDHKCSKDGDQKSCCKKK
jgi:hypothetical protein